MPTPVAGIVLPVDVFRVEVGSLVPVLLGDGRRGVTVRERDNPDHAALPALSSHYDTCTHIAPSDRIPPHALLWPRCRTCRRPMRVYEPRQRTHPNCDGDPPQCR